MFRQLLAPAPRRRRQTATTGAQVLEVRQMPSSIGLRVADTPTPDPGATVTTEPSDGERKGDVKPVVDADGNYWLYRESTGEYLPWPS